MLATADGGAGAMLAGEHPAARHLRHRAEARAGALPRVRQVLREPAAHGEDAPAVPGAPRLRCSAKEASFEYIM